MRNVVVYQNSLVQSWKIYSLLTCAPHRAVSWFWFSDSDAGHGSLSFHINLLCNMHCPPQNLRVTFSVSEIYNIDVFTCYTSKFWVYKISLQFLLCSVFFPFNLLCAHSLGIITNCSEIKKHFFSPHGVTVLFFPISCCQRYVSMCGY